MRTLQGMGKEYIAVHLIGKYPQTWIQKKRITRCSEMVAIVSESSCPCFLLQSGIFNKAKLKNSEDKSIHNSLILIVIISQLCS